MRPVLHSVKRAEIFLRNVRTRMPFRYGVATMTSVPIAHLVIHTECSGKVTQGVAADILPPKWFDKDPTKDFRANVADLLAAVEFARKRYVGSTGTPFELWRAHYAGVLRDGDARGLNHLTSSFGSSLFERAVADAACRAAGVGFDAAVRQNLLGIEWHAQLMAALPDQPVTEMFVRHTVGLGDPLVAGDVQPEEQLNDGLPQTLEEYVRRLGVRYFKLKVNGQLDNDLRRLTSVAAILDAHVRGDYFSSLDGNEQYQRPEDFQQLLDRMRAAPALQRLFRSILFIEQPLERSVALDPAIGGALRDICAIKPVIIDESDSDLDSFERARAIGYRGVSSKNCKGIYKSLRNRALIGRDPRLVMSGEDLVNLPLVPVQQDLCTLATIGVTHAERNGHHYVRGLAHLSPRERRDALRLHGDLYAGSPDAAALCVRDGKIRIGSLQCAGYGCAVEPDLDAMTPLEDWKFESLGVS